MIRIAHFGDLHIADGPRGDDAYRCAMAGIEDAAAQRADLIVFPGDLFDCGTHRHARPSERNQLLRILQAAADAAPVIGVRGNHDYPGDLDIYREVRGEHRIEILDRPALRPVDTKAGPVLTAFVPYPTKAWLHAQANFSAPQADQAAQSALSALLGAWGSEIRAHEGPSLFVAHINVAGSRASTGQPLIGRELEIAPGDLLDVGATYYALGHIHARQSFAPNCWYAGSVSRMDFGEAEEKGWNLVTVAECDGCGGAICAECRGSGWRASVEFRQVPARKMLHIGGGDGWPDPADVLDADVRYRYSVPEERANDVDEEQIRRRLAGAHSLKIERIVTRSARVRSEAITKARTLAEKLAAYWQATGALEPEVEDRVLAKAAVLQAQPADVVLEGVRDGAA